MQGTLHAGYTAELHVQGTPAFSYMQGTLYVEQYVLGVDRVAAGDTPWCCSMHASRLFGVMVAQNSVRVGLLAAATLVCACWGISVRTAVWQG